MAIISSVYYLLILAPVLKQSQNLRETKKVLQLHHINLVQNRLSYVELARLNWNSANFQSETSDLVETIQDTQARGAELAAEYPSVPDIGGLDIDYLRLISDTSELFGNQAILLEQITQTESYDEGLEIVKSQESVDLLMKQTKLISEYQNKIDELERMLGR